MDGRWAVDEDPERYRFHNEAEAQDRGRLLAGDSVNPPNSAITMIDGRRRPNAEPQGNA
jgi:hypothetical protein